MERIDYNYWNNANVNRSAFIFKSEKPVLSTKKRDRMYAENVMDILRKWYSKPVITINQVLNSSFKMLLELAEKMNHGWNIEIYPCGRDSGGDFNRCMGGMFYVKLKDAYGYEYMEIRCYCSSDIMTKILHVLEKKFKKWNSDKIINVPCIAGSAVLFTKKGWFIYSKHDEDYILDRECYSFSVSPASFLELPLLSYPIGLMYTLLIMASGTRNAWFKYLYDIEKCEAEDIIE